MTTSDAIKKAVKKYQTEKTDCLYIRVPKGKKQAIRNHAASQGEGLTQFVCRAIEETIARDTTK